MKKVAIVILNFNGGENTHECLKSIKKLQSNTYKLQIIVVDNASKDNSLKIIKSDFSEIDILENKDNLGFSEGNNVGIRYALNNGSDYILVLNNDTIVDKNLLEELIKTIEKDRRIGIISPKIYFAKGYEFHKSRYKSSDLGKVLWYAGGVMDLNNVIGHHRGVDEIDNGKYDKEEETDYATGCCMFIKREVLEKVGLFDKKYYLYYEDSDLSFRAKKTGYKIIYNPKAILWHKNAGSAGGSGSKLQDYYITRNRLLFGMKYISLRVKLSLIRESVKLLINGREWQKRGVLDFYLGKMNSGTYK